MFAPWKCVLFAVPIVLPMKSVTDSLDFIRRSSNSLVKGWSNACFEPYLILKTSFSLNPKSAWKFPFGESSLKLKDQLLETSSFLLPTHLSFQSVKALACASAGVSLVVDSTTPPSTMSQNSLDLKKFSIKTRNWWLCEVAAIKCHLLQALTPNVRA